jgi:hypothetical protein
MKKLFFVLALISSMVSYARWEKIKGSGTIKKETRQTGVYTGITSNGSMNIELTYGNPGSITIEADDNLLEYIETKVENGKLVIRTKNKISIQPKSKITIWVPANTLTEVNLHGSGNIKGDGAFSNTGKTRIGVSGSGNINLGFNSFNETIVSVSGSGNVTLKGKSTNNIDVSVSGSGNVDASAVSCNDAFAAVSGSGDVHVQASRTINAKISGSGNVYYKGSASKLNSKTSGTGKVIKV